MSSITMRLRKGSAGAVVKRDAEFAWFFGLTLGDLTPEGHTNSRSDFKLRVRIHG